MSTPYTTLVLSRAEYLALLAALDDRVERCEQRAADDDDYWRDLARRNRSDEWIARELGMEPDEVLRLKQVTAMAELFADAEFSEAWQAAG